MTGQPDKQHHKTKWHCPSCHAEFFDPMMSAGYPTCPHCFMALPDNAKIIARPEHVFVTINARTGDKVPERVIPKRSHYNAPAGGVDTSALDRLLEGDI
jgi:hypothetical protein